MEVCGTHTHELFRTGIRFALPNWVKLISGPGCPVCVTDDKDLAKVILMATNYDLTVITFGDMIKGTNTFRVFSFITQRREKCSSCLFTC